MPKEVTNGAWTSNGKIRDALKTAIESKRARLIASIPHFEGAFFGEEVDEEKPSNAWKRLADDVAICIKVKHLLYSLLDHSETVPTECEQWIDEAVLLSRWEAYHTSAV